MTMTLTKFKKKHEIEKKRAMNSVSLMSPVWRSGPCTYPFGALSGRRSHLHYRNGDIACRVIARPWQKCARAKTNTAW